MMGIVRVIAGFLIGLIASLALLLLTRAQVYEDQHDRLAALKDKYVSAKWHLLNRERLLDQVREVKDTVDGLARVLPDQIDTSFAPVLAAARRYHLSVEASALGMEIDREFYAARGLAIVVTGRFQDLGAFAAELGKAPGCLLLERLNLSRMPGEKVRMEGVVFAHRYLADAEVEQRRKAAKAAKP